MKLSRLCEQDKILQELEARIRTLKDDKVLIIHINISILCAQYLCVGLPVLLCSVTAFRVKTVFTILL